MAHIEETAEEAVTKYIQLVEEEKVLRSAITHAQVLGYDALVCRLRRRLRRCVDSMSDIGAEMINPPA